jgi:transglutaminase-like putative cysteine protease
VSLWRDDPRASPATLAALVAVTLVAVGSLSRLFVGPRYLAWALPAVAIGAAFALYFGRRSLGLGFAFLAAGWLLSMPGLFARSETASGFPTGHSIRVAWNVLSSGLRGAAKAVPPLEAEPHHLALVWSAFLFLGFLGASWVVVRRPVGAIISALGVVTFSGSLGDGRGRTAFALAAVVTTGAFFLSEGRQRIGRWASGRVRVPAWFGIPTLGAACAFALAAPLLIGDAPLVTLRSAIRPRLVIIKPLSDIRRQLKVDPPIEVMRVTAARATYWRLTGLDTYDGREWILEAHPRPVLRGDVRPPEPPATGDMLEQRFRLTSLLSPWMPAAYAARSIDTQASVELDERSQTLLLRDDTSPGLAYTVRSQLPKISENLYALAEDVDDPNEKIMGDQARAIVAGARTPLETARRLEEHFKAFTYNEDVDGGHSMQRLQRFLRDRTGYCEQFAATMTLMLRGLGIDARVGVGFLPGAEGNGEFVVSTREAHAWVEAAIPGAGWTSFDPTPARPGSTTPEPEQEDAALESPPPPEQTSNPAQTPETQPAPEGAEIPGGRPWWFSRGFIAFILVLAAVRALPTAKRIRRTIRRLRPPQEAVLGAYAELTDRARDLGWRSTPSETHWEFTKRFAHDEQHAASISGLAVRTIYGPDATTKEDATTAWHNVPMAIRALGRRTPWWRRALAPLDPRTFIPSKALGRVSSAFAR